MKISEAIYILENETIASVEFDVLVKETLFYLGELAKKEGKWDKELLNELEQEQVYKPEELIDKINDATLTLASNAIVPIDECEEDAVDTMTPPPILVKERQIALLDTPNFELPLLCILQQAILVRETGQVAPQQLIDVSRLLQCYLANCSNIQLSVLWQEEYERSITYKNTEKRIERWALSDNLAQERLFIRKHFKTLPENTSLNEAVQAILSINRNEYPYNEAGNQMTKKLMKQLAIFLYDSSFGD